jgi:hypothetical protein
MRRAQGLTSSDSVSVQSTMSVLPISASSINTNSPQATGSVLPSPTLVNSHSGSLRESGSVIQTNSPHTTGSVLPSQTLSGSPIHSPNLVNTYTGSSTLTYSSTSSPTYSGPATLNCLCPDITSTRLQVQLPVPTSDMTVFPSSYLLTIGVPSGCVILIILSYMCSLYLKNKALNNRLKYLQEQLDAKQKLGPHFQVRNILGRTHY